MGLNIKPKFDATVQTSHQSQQYGIYAQVSKSTLLFYISRRLKYSIYSGGSLEFSNCIHSFIFPSESRLSFFSFIAKLTRHI